MNRRALILVLPLLGAAMCYGRALRGGFVFDDLDSVLRDPAARSLSVSTRMLLPSARLPARKRAGTLPMTFYLRRAVGPEPLGIRVPCSGKARR